MHYSLLYSTTLFVSFSLTLILFAYHSRYWNSRTHIPLLVIYMLNMTSALMCIVWVFVDGRPELIPVNYIANIIEFNCMGFCGYFWLIHCLNYVNIPVLKTKKAKLLIALPVLILMLLIICTPYTHWAFYIDEGGYFRRGLIYGMQQTGYLYLCASTVICLIFRKKCSTTSERRHLSVLATFPLPPLLLGGIQILMPSGLAPTLQFSILVSLLLVFVDELDQKITRDSLTKLINRYEFERILQSRMQGFRPQGARICVLMSDVDSFKSINDNYGHQQGDASLQIVGRSLSKTAARFDGISARIGGDEFVTLIETDSADEINEFKKQLDAELTKACLNLPYTLRLSTGLAEYDGSLSMMQLLNLADVNMYKQKKIQKEAPAFS